MHGQSECDISSIFTIIFHSGETINLGKNNKQTKKRQLEEDYTHLKDAAIGVLEHPQERLGLVPFDLGCATHEWMSMSSSSWFGTCMHVLEAGRGDAY